MGHAGAVTGVVLEETIAGPLVATTSLDRFLRVSCCDTRKELKKVYLGHLPSCLLVSKVIRDTGKSAASTDKLWQQLSKVSE